ncbi:MAG: hypothetical protein O3C40_33235 [Planctomycetota bacterium]|nr:hypothetical protein [Planctomycetota bacterium]
MEPMDLLFKVYNANFDQLEHKVRHLNEEFGAPDISKMWAKRFTREQFDHYLAESSLPSESRRLFVLGLVHDREDLRSQLPKHLAAYLSPSESSQRKSVA